MIFYRYFLQVLQGCLNIVYHFIVLLINIFVRVFFILSVIILQFYFYTHNGFVGIGGFPLFILRKVSTLKIVCLIMLFLFSHVVTNILLHQRVELRLGTGICLSSSFLRENPVGESGGGLAPKGNHGETV